MPNTMRFKPAHMTPADAFFHTVHDYPGGAVSLAPRMGLSAGVLRNKANRNCSTNHVLLEDADRAMALTGDFRVLHALAMAHGHVCLKLDTDVPASDLAVLDLVTEVWAANGDVGCAVRTTLADNRVDMREVREVRAAIYRQIQVLQMMLGRLEDMAEPERRPAANEAV
ncbi:MAG: phage regulatory CII family protein [Moraxellaceae bacterium]|nr:phage regulatory CII family protein [Moraxellaceae bacterium]